MTLLSSSICINLFQKVAIHAKATAFTITKQSLMKSIKISVIISQYLVEIGEKMFVLTKPEIDAKKESRARERCVQTVAVHQHVCAEESHI